MAGAIHVVTVQRGVDPRRFALVTSGGAGPLHAARIAERFGIAKVIVPPACGVASALGLLASDLRADRVRTLQLADADVRVDVLAGPLAELEAATAADVGAGTGAGTGRGVRLRRSADVRFRGQSHELSVALADGPLTDDHLARLRDDFVRRHREVFGVGTPGPVEVVNVRVRATAPVGRARFHRAPSPSVGGAAGTGEAPVRRPAWFRELGGAVAVPVVTLARGPAGGPVAGPALIESPESTTLVPPGWTAVITAAGATLLARDDGTGGAAAPGDGTGAPGDGTGGDAP
jgi:N-methylhydantoinase A